MAIEVSDLPPKYQAQALKKYMEQEQCRGRAESATPAKGTVKPSKYHNIPTERITESGTVVHFDSQKEARQYDSLIRKLQSGQIRDLRLQVDFTLQEAYTDIEGRRVRAIRYKADFTYYQPQGFEGLGSHAAYWADQEGTPWKLVVEDVKSKPTRTKEYAIKRKILKDRLGIDIIEV